ncbi:alpha/beta fold hydrolase [Clostridium sp. YIM B02551]|uniref:alpha/beta fold hydrolase n=1 Tax=Clostridium sp. YIM B02551 TaxID=2910679 RepID=UPI001EEB5011|nr:alpha/beta hydrolase [Clostridium sp. YIM B02551]
MNQLINTTLGKVNTKVAGKKGKPVILFIHGLMASLQYFNELIEELQNDYYMIAVDLVGNGDSDKPEKDIYTMENQAASIWEVVSQLNIDCKINLVGHSSGGAVAIEMANQHREKVERIIMLGTSTDFTYAKLNPMLSYFSKPIIGSIIKFALNFIKLGKKPPEAFSENYDMKQLKHPEILTGALQRMTVYSIVHTQEMFPVYTAKKPLHSRLDELKLPTLVLLGTDDRVATSKGAAHDEAVYKNVQTVTFNWINGAGHMLMIEKVEEVSMAIKNFIPSI